MADQEFLASYAVSIDESGVRRLQQILDENREKANQAAAAFSGVESAIRRLFRSGFSSFAENLRNYFFGPSSGSSPGSPSGGTPSGSPAPDTPALSGLSANLISEGMKSLSEMKTGLQTFLNTSGGADAVERNESGRRSAETAGLLSSIAAGVSRLAASGTGGDPGSSGSGGSSPSNSSSGTSGTFPVNLDLSRRTRPCPPSWPGPPPASGSRRTPPASSPPRPAPWSGSAPCSPPRT